MRAGKDWRQLGHTTERPIHLPDNDHMKDEDSYFHKRKKMGGRSQDGGGIGRGDHFLFYKFIERTERWTKFTKQLLIASSGHQVPRKAAHCLRGEVGQGWWRLKRETRDRGTETPPGKGVLLEEVSNHQETLALAGLGEVFKSQRAT